MSDEEAFEESDKGHEKKPGVLSDTAKGLIVGAAGALALAGIVYAITREDKPKPVKHAAATSPPTTVFYGDLPLDQDMFAEPEVVNGPSAETAEVEVTEASTDEGGLKITEVLKDVSTVGTAVRGISALEPVAEMLIALL